MQINLQNCEKNGFFSCKNKIFVVPLHLEVICRKMAFHNELGKIGEDLAVKHLVSKGLTIVERNWKCGDLETDIIARDGQTFVFAEVKTRSDNGDTHPEDAVDYLRKRRLTAGAQAYLRYNQIDDPWRFDIIAITMKETGAEINHIEDAFMPTTKTISSKSFNGQDRWKPKRRIFPKR